MTDTPWWDRGRHADRRGVLLTRNRIKSAIRSWFESHGFVEVETAALQVSPGNEAHLHAFETDFVSEAGTRTRYHLHTSPEFACKKLLAAGETSIFTFAPCFRNAERGRLHAPEFTMLEWYRVGATYEQLWEDCAEIIRIAARASGRGTWAWDGRSCDTMRAFAATTLEQAFAQFAQIPLHESIRADGKTDRDQLAAHATRIGVRVAADDTWSDLFSRILATRIEPHLGELRPEVLCEYPAQEAALARRLPDDPAYAERFELYVCGVELANGFGELTDAPEQRRRFETEMDEKQRVYGRRYPIDEDFLTALAQMPPSAGCALGFDRLVMLATGATHIDQVLWTPIAVPP